MAEDWSAGLMDLGSGGGREFGRSVATCSPPDKTLSPNRLVA